MCVVLIYALTLHKTQLGLAVCLLCSKHVVNWGAERPLVDRLYNGSIHIVLEGCFSCGLFFLTLKMFN